MIGSLGIAIGYEPEIVESSIQMSPEIAIGIFIIVFITIFTISIFYRMYKTWT